MKEILCGTNDKEPPTEVVAQLAQELYNSGLLVTLIADLQLIDFEVNCQRKTSLLCNFNICYYKYLTLIFYYYLLFKNPVFSKTSKITLIFF